MRSSDEVEWLKDQMFEGEQRGGVSSNNFVYLKTANKFKRFGNIRLTFFSSSKFRSFFSSLQIRTPSRTAAIRFSKFRSEICETEIAVSLPDFPFGRVRKSAPNAMRVEKFVPISEFTRAESPAHTHKIMNLQKLC